MKRPEYVSMAVSAVKKAIDGNYSPSDEFMLRSVFSRSGFTDGYLNSKLGKNMFGTRQKEDVVATTNDVLKEIAKNYEKETALIGVDIDFVCKENQNAVLTVKTDKKEVKAVGRKAPIVKTNSKLKEYLRKPGSLIMLILIMLAAAITVGIMVYLVAYIVIRGVPYINADLFAWKYNSDNVSMTPAIINTIIIVAMTLIISVPIGVAAAIYLVEYAKRGSKLVKIIRVTTETLAGIPSIVFGLFGFLAFVLALHWGYSLIAGVLTLAIMVLPTIIRTTEEALIAVPDSFREGSFGLGAGKLRTIFVIVLPAAVPGILSGVILAIGRIVGESAALIFTAGSVAAVPWGSGKFFLSSTRTLAVHMYCLLSEGLYTNQAYATAVILLIIILIINGLSGILANKIGKENK